MLGHPFNLPHLIPLVEVSGGKQTSVENVSKAMAFYTALGKTPIRLNQEVKGHVANRLQAALWREAFSLVERGIVSVKDIDAAIANAPGLRWALLAPFLTLHAYGGPKGITHTLQHLGPAMRELVQDIGAYPETETISGIKRGCPFSFRSFFFSEWLRIKSKLNVGVSF